MVRWEHLYLLGTMVFSIAGDVVRDFDEEHLEGSEDDYEQARQEVEVQIQKVLLGFTVAYAVEIGTVSVGEGTYQHGGVAHVLLPVEDSFLTTVLTSSAKSAQT
jgi:hypothetical protein